MKTSVNRFHLASATLHATPRIIQALEAREEAMRARELARLLGVTRQYVYKMAAAGLIPSFRVGNAVRFDPVLIADWLRRKIPAPTIADNRQQIAV
jgi:excisionase family DNA binding protein